MGALPLVSLIAVFGQQNSCGTLADGLVRTHALSSLANGDIGVVARCSDMLTWTHKRLSQSEMTGAR